MSLASATRLVLGGEAADRGDRAEDLLAGDLGAGGHAVEHGGLEVEALALERLAAGQDARAAGDRVVDEAGDAVAWRRG